MVFVSLRPKNEKTKQTNDKLQITVKRKRGYRFGNGSGKKQLHIREEIFGYDAEN